MIDRDMWLSALAAAGVERMVADDSALTMHEFAALIGMKKTAAQERMAVLVKQGKAVRVMKRISRADGQLAPVGAYRLVTEHAMSPAIHENETLDGAATIDQAPEPDDEDLRTKRNNGRRTQGTPRTHHQQVQRGRRRKV